MLSLNHENRFEWTGILKTENNRNIQNNES
jgi:hypothetical protein